MVSWIPALLRGARITISLTVCALSAGLLLSLFIALGKMAKSKILNALCTAYTFFFRGTPLLMQLYFIYYALPTFAPSFNIQTGNSERDRFLYAFIAFSFNCAAYNAEIIRAAIQSIDKGQFEASHALGLTYMQAMKLVIIPQSIRRLIPPVGNEFILLLKDVALVSMIALVDITMVTRNIESSTRSALVYIPAMILYLLITAVFTIIFRNLEKKYSVYE